MKTEVNLIPDDYISPRQKTLIQRIVLAAFLVLLCVLGGGGFLLHEYQKNLAVELTSLESENAALQSEVESLAKLQEGMNELQERIDLKSSLQKRIFINKENIEEIKELLEDKMLVTTINIADNNSILIEGKSNHLQNVAVATRQLSELDYLQNVNYQQVEYQVAGEEESSIYDDDYELGSTYYAFTISARLNDESQS